MAEERLIIHPSLVRQLINAQFPQWSDLSIKPVQWNGWDNTTFRLGNRMKVRLPTAARYAAQVEKERRWLPHFAGFLPVRIPVPLALGAPTDKYPFPWSVCSWIEGDLVSETNVLDLDRLATELAQFLTALYHVPTVSGPGPGPHSFFRGGSLRVYDSETRECLARLKGKLDVVTAASVWETALLSRYEAPAVWVHGDFAPTNLLVANGSLSAVIDFGCCAVGDPACDLVIAWTLFEGQSREMFRSAIAADQGTWARARGWALWKALIQVVKQEGPIDKNEWIAQNARRIADDILSEHKNKSLAHL